MDALALEATSGKKSANGAAAVVPLVPPPAPGKRKPAKKAKKAVVFFEVEILDAKTKDKLCFLDKVRTCVIYNNSHHVLCYYYIF